MQKKPDDRFADMGEMVTALTGVGLATLPAARTPSPGTPPIAAGTGRKVSSADALATVRKIQLSVSPDAKSTLLRPPPQLPQHEQANLQRRPFQTQP